MSAAVRVREARPGELEAVLDMYEWLFEPPGAVPPGWDREAAGARLAGAISSDATAILVAEWEARLIGLCTTYLDLDSVRFGPRAWVEDLVTAPDQRSRGIGELLLGRAMDWARERGASHLELDSGDARLDAHRFYERLKPSWAGRQFSWWLGDD